MKMMKIMTKEGIAMKKMKMVLSMCIMFTLVMLCGTVSRAAQELEINTPIQVSTDIGTYQFTIEKQGKVMLNATPVDGEKYVYGRFAIYETDEDENAILVSECGYYDYYTGYDRSYSSLETTPVRLDAGTYFITCTARSTRPANLLINYTEENPDEFETEKNNTWSTANTIELNKEYKANLQSSSDVDTYKFELEQEGSIFINLKNIDAVSNRWKAELYVEDTDNNVNLIDSWTNTTNKNSKFTKYRLPKGRYYIKVSRGNGYTSADYSIGTTYVAETGDESEIEYNDTISTANNIVTNQEYKANIHTINDRDYYVFTIEKTSRITVQLRQDTDNVTSGLYGVTLYRKDEADNLIMYGRFNTISNKISKGNEVVAPEGTYIVYVKNNNGVVEDQNDYMLKIIQEETEEPSTITDIPKDVEGQSGIPMTVNNKTLVSTQEGRYLFVIPKAGIISLNATPVDGEEDVYGRFAIYETDKDENEILVSECGYYSYYTRYDPSYRSLETTPVRLDAGTYIIKYAANYTRSANLLIDYTEIPDLSESVIEPISDTVYTGEAIIPKLTVTYKGKKLEEKKEYTATYSNNISAGTATVTINPVEDASVGTQTTQFIIKKRAIPVPVVQQSEFVYDGTAKEVLLSSKDTQYLIAENNKNVNAGIYEAKYRIDTNNCVWENGKNDVISIPWSIKKANPDLSIGTITYTKTVGDPAFALTDISTNSDGMIKYTVTQGTDVISVNAEGLVTPLKAGTSVISVMVSATTNYNESVNKTVNVLINDKPIISDENTAKDTSVDANSNTNNADDSEILSVSRVNNIKANISKAVNKKGKKIVLSISGLSDCDGYQIQYGTNAKFKGAKTTKKNTNTVTLKKLKKGKKYYIRTRVYKKIGGEIYYGKWSTKKSVKIKK